jgi:hypothetical protein
LAAFQYRHAYGNLMNDHRVDFVAAAMRGVPDQLSKTDDNDSYELAYVGEHSIVPHSARLERVVGLTDVQLHVVQQLSQLPWRIVGVRFDSWYSKLVAHSAISGRWTYLIEDGAQTRDDIIDNLLVI